MELLCLKLGCTGSSEFTHVTLLEITCHAHICDYDYDIYIFYFRSVNEVICHGIPDSRKLEDGDIVNSEYHCFFYHPQKIME